MAGFIGSPSMNFVPARVENGVVKLPMVDLPVDDATLRAVGGAKSLVAGIRPEHFEDATLLPADQRAAGAVFRTKVDVLESMGSELYAHFRLTSGGGVQSDALNELAADTGSDTVGEADVIARLVPESRARQGSEIDLWIDPAKILFFDAEGGAALRPERGASGPASGSQPGAVPAR